MKRNIDEKSIIYLHPGEAYFSTKPFVVSTILGSCISITMFNKSKHFAGISHCQLPKCKEDKNICCNCHEAYKYIDCTIKKMLDKFEQKKIKQSDIEIKIFGGADVLNTSPNSKVNSVGKQNIIAAKKAVNEYDLKIAASDVGGKQGRKILFNSANGEILLQRMKVYEKD